MTKKWNKMRVIYLFLITLSIGLSSCTKESEYSCDAGDSNIVGARCDDGTRSSATGQGACSGHGGVDYWICED